MYPKCLVLGTLKMSIQKLHKLDLINYLLNYWYEVEIKIWFAQRSLAQSKWAVPHIFLCFDHSPVTTFSGSNGELNLHANSTGLSPDCWIPIIPTYYTMYCSLENAKATLLIQHLNEARP